MANSRTRRLLLSGAFFAIIVVIAIFNNYGLLKRAELEIEKKTILNAISTAQAQNDSLRRLIKTLETDTLELERIAREKYGMIKPDEKVYFIRDNSSRQK